METIEDIIADMRGLARLNETSTDKVPRKLQAIALRIFANHIEEAVTNCSQLKMREALESLTQHFCKNCPNNGPDGCELSKDDGRFEFLCHKLKQARAILSAPPRNCDRFADELDAQIEFLNEVWLISVDKDTMLERDKFENWTEEMKSRYAKWLLAEAKGGTNGENNSRA